MNDNLTTDEATYGQQGPAFEILRLLGRRGPSGVKELAEELGVTANAVREHVHQLLDAQLITTSKLRGGAGRPAHLYALSDKAQALFPQAYDTLIELLIEEITDQQNPAEATRLLKAIGDRLGREVLAGVESDDLRERLLALSDAMERRGIQLTLCESEAGLALHEWCCPYFSLASKHTAVCEMEQRMLERALGVKVTIAERRLDGYAGCKFVVEQS